MLDASALRTSRLFPRLSRVLLLAFIPIVATCSDANEVEGFIRFRLDGEQVEFERSSEDPWGHGAAIARDDGGTQITGAEGGDSLSLNIPAQATGHFDSEAIPDYFSLNAEMYWNGTTYRGEGEILAVVGAEVDIDVSEYGDLGERVLGTFSATLIRLDCWNELQTDCPADEPGNSVVLTAGEFDVESRDPPDA